MTAILIVALAVVLLVCGFLFWPARRPDALRSPLTRARLAAAEEKRHWKRLHAIRENRALGPVAHEEFLEAHSALGRASAPQRQRGGRTPRGS